jgi:hypothetical protein
MTTYIVTAKITMRNVIAFRVTRLALFLFGDQAFIWCVNNLFEGEIWVRESWT